MVSKQSYLSIVESSCTASKRERERGEGGGWGLHFWNRPTPMPLSTPHAHSFTPLGGVAGMVWIAFATAGSPWGTPPGHKFPRDGIRMNLRCQNVERRFSVVGEISISICNVYFAIPFKIDRKHSLDSAGCSTESFIRIFKATTLAIWMVDLINATHSASTLREVRCRENN